MAKMIQCSKIDLAAGCKHIMIANTEDDVLQKAADHARAHGILEWTPEMMQRVRALIRECPWTVLERTQRSNS